MPVVSLPGSMTFSYHGPQESSGDLVMRWKSCVDLELSGNKKGLIVAGMNSEVSNSHFVAGRIMRRSSDIDTQVGQIDGRRAKARARRRPGVMILTGSLVRRPVTSEWPWSRH